MEGFSIYDGELGLLLDLDEGTLSVYKNGTRLGVMMRSHTGEYCWVANMLLKRMVAPMNRMYVLKGPQFHQPRERRTACGYLMR